MRHLLFGAFLSLMYTSGMAQLHDHNNDHKHHHLESELGIGAAPTIVFSPGERIANPGFHFHIIKLFNEKIGGGLGYEAVFEENMHHTITAFGKYFITDFLSINAGPGISKPTAEHNEYSLIGHIELATAFDVWKIHLGPMIGYGISAEHSHFSAGLHIGWHF